MMSPGRERGSRINSMFTIVPKKSAKAATRRLSVGVLAAALTLTPVMADDVLFATPPSSRSASEAAVGTLANIMLNMQLRHIKVWSAGRAKNWDLVKYEAEKLKADFDAATGFYRGLPVNDIVTAAKPLNVLIDAAANKDPALYARSFNQLTDACNSCHAAGQVGVVRIRVPRTPPFDNQSYER
jgi:hypothetical protein